MNELTHWGIKGQKWGVRRYQNPDGTLTEAGKKRYYRTISDGEVTLAEKKKFLRKSGSGNYEIRANNKKVGKMIVDDFDDHRYIDWVGIDDKYKRQGYGQKALDLIIADGKKKALKYIELDAAGLDPAARHIYEKKGFKAVDELKKSDVWDTLLTMRKEL